MTMLYSRSWRQTSLFEQSFEYKERSDKGWGLIDCISFVVMKNAGVTEALTFDRHFQQAAFKDLMTE